MPSTSRPPVAVVGCGVIGRSWIRVFARAGHDVRVWDRALHAVAAVIRDGLGLRWALMGPFGVANTNADGGVREYFGRCGASFQSLWGDLATDVTFDEAVLEKLGAETDAMVGDVPRERIRAWRDRMVDRNTTLKRSEDGP